MKTITLQGTQEEFNNLYQGVFDEDKVPQEVETRFYVLDTQDISIDKGFEELTEKEWIIECERQGRVYSTQGFQRAFNEEEINTSIDVLRIISVSLFGAKNLKTEKI
jgi:hypothetical protein